MSRTQPKSKPLHEGRRISPAQFLDIADDGHRYELIEGVLHLSPSPIDDHLRPHSKFLEILVSYFQAHPDAGRYFFDFSVFLPDDNVWEPDLCVVLAENAHIVEGHIHGAPDLTVEILSPSTRDRDLGVKADSYLRCGVKEYWIVDPRNESVQAWQNNDDAWEKRAGDVLESQVLPGLTVRAERLFAR